MQLRPIRPDSYDQFTEIVSSRNLQYPTLLLRFPISKKSIGTMTLSMCNMDSERGAVLTQSAIVWTLRVRRPPFWLIVTVLDRNCYLPMIHMSHPTVCVRVKWDCLWYETICRCVYGPEMIITAVYVCVNRRLSQMRALQAGGRELGRIL